MYAPGAFVYTAQSKRPVADSDSKTCIRCVQHHGRSLLTVIHSLALREVFVLPSEGGECVAEIWDSRRE